MNRTIVYRVIRTLVMVERTNLDFSTIINVSRISNTTPSIPIKHVVLGSWSVFTKHVVVRMQVAFGCVSPKRSPSVPTSLSIHHGVSFLSCSNHWPRSLPTARLLSSPTACSPRLLRTQQAAPTHATGHQSSPAAPIPTTTPWRLKTWSSLAAWRSRRTQWWPLAVWTMEFSCMECTRNRI